MDLPKNENENEKHDREVFIYSSFFLSLDIENHPCLGEVEFA